MVIEMDDRILGVRLFMKIQDVAIETIIYCMEISGRMMKDVALYLKLQAKYYMDITWKNGVKNLFDIHDYSYYKKNIKEGYKRYRRLYRKLFKILCRKIILKIIAEQMLKIISGESLDNYDPYCRYIEIFEEIDTKYIDESNRQYIQLDLKKAIEYFKKNYQHMANRFEIR